MSAAFSLTAFILGKLPHYSKLHDLLCYVNARVLTTYFFENNAIRKTFALSGSGSASWRLVYISVR